MEVLMISYEVSAGLLSVFDLFEFYFHQIIQNLKILSKIINFDSSFSVKLQFVELSSKFKLEDIHICVQFVDRVFGLFLPHVHIFVYFFIMLLMVLKINLLLTNFLVLLNQLLLDPIFEFVLYFLH